MIFFDTIREAFKCLMSNRLRSFLSMLGIIIGVAAVVSVVSISNGAEKQVLDRLENLGTNLITITPGVSRGNGGRVSQELADLFTYDLTDQIRQFCPSVLNITPYIDGNGLALYESTNVQSRVRATTPEFFSMVDLKIERGRLFTETDIQENTLTVVMGSQAAQDLFGNTNPVGQEFKFIKGNQNFTVLVIGVLASKGQVMFSNYDSQIFFPITTWMNRVQKTKFVNGFAAQARSKELAATAVDEIEYLLYQKYQDLTKFNVMSQTEMLSVASDYSRTFKILLGGIASIALLVGGIGIMNITLVSVTERTREIGIRKALGAKPRLILLQFLVEACAVSVSGGILGLIVGVFAAMLISKFGGWPFLITPVSALLAMGFSALIGIFFGIYPASRASRLDPVNALSYE